MAIPHGTMGGLQCEIAVFPGLTHLHLDAYITLD